MQAVRGRRVFWYFVLFAQDGLLHGEVPLPVLVLHVHEPRFDAVDLLAQLDDLELQVDGVLPDLFDPVVEGGEDAVHEGGGSECHACGQIWEGN